MFTLNILSLQNRYQICFFFLYSDMHMLGFNFILGRICIFLCFKLIIQNKIKFRPRMKLNHNVLYCSSKLKKKIGVIIHKLELADKGNEKSTQVTTFSPVTYIKIIMYMVPLYHFVAFDVQSGATLCTLVQLGVVWCDLVQIRATWCRLVQPGADWCNLVQVGTTWCRLVQLGAGQCNLAQFGATWFSMVQLGAGYKNLVQSGAT